MVREKSFLWQSLWFVETGIWNCDQTANSNSYFRGAWSGVKHLLLSVMSSKLSREQSLTIPLLQSGFSSEHGKLLNLPVSWIFSFLSSSCCEQRCRLQVTFVFLPRANFENRDSGINRFCLRSRARRSRFRRRWRRWRWNWRWPGDRIRRILRLVRARNSNQFAGHGQASANAKCILWFE